MTPDEMTRLRALADAATPGPWEFQPWSTCPLPSGDYKESILLANAAHDGEIVRELGNQDGDFIAAARTAVPDLLDEVEALRARIDKVRAEHGELVFGADLADPIHTGECEWCGCSTAYPCWTRRVLDGEEGA
ncbi:hypothetical protein [Brachybacterium nesterenkovii]|uniref:hypothetical protein n=1 Tax=Brachybacterium nesterenkovii TaxID=47847 RepID=UPI00321AC8FA